MKKSKGFSIKFVLLYTVISISIMGVTAIFINQAFNKRLNREMNHLVNMNIGMTNLKKYLGDNSLLISGYFNHNSDDYFEQYNSNKQHIRSIGKNIYETIKYDENGMMYYRILFNLLEYESELSSKLFQMQTQDVQTYEKQQDIKKLYSYLDQVSNYLTEACIDYQTAKYGEIYNNYQRTQNYIYMGMILIVLLNYSYITRLIANIVSNLSKFNKAAANLAMGNWYIPDINKQKCVELDLFATAFNKMKNDIQENIRQIELNSQLELELYEQKLKNVEMDQLLKESQLISLQSQMNPHFLFNTMNLISRTAMFDGNKTIVKLMDSMSKILRYNLNNIRNMVTLKEEIDIVQAYLYIQSSRFMDSMSFTIDIDLDSLTLEDILVPPMIIQPIVENSIKHGFKNKEEGRKIVISVVQEQDNVLISIEDNGEGIPNGEINFESNKVGLRNVRKRLELYFGDKDLLKIKSEPDEGTTVVIIIPLGGEHND